MDAPFHSTGKRDYLRYSSDAGQDDGERACEVQDAEPDDEERDAGLAPPLLIEGHGTSRECSCIRCGKEFRPDLSQRCVDTRTVPICPFCGGPIKVEAISGIEE